MQDATPGSTSNGTTVKLTVDGAVAVITLARPAARNALSLAMLRDLHSRIVELEARDDIRAVIVAAEGPVFCPGHDLKELTAARAHPDGGRAFYAETMAACAAMMQAIVRASKPYIAAVEGTATAAGCQLVATCDLAVADPAATFCTPGVHIGLFCSTPMVALSRNVSNKHAMEMLLLGEAVSANRAAELGLVNRVAASGGAIDGARDMANVIASKSRVTLGIGKRAFYEQREMSLSAAYDYAADVMTRNMMERDAREGIAAFVEKRRPDWQN